MGLTPNVGVGYATPTTKPPVANQTLSPYDNNPSEFQGSLANQSAIDALKLAADGKTQTQTQNISRQGAVANLPVQAQQAAQSQSEFTNLLGAVKPYFGTDGSSSSSSSSGAGAGASIMPWSGAGNVSQGGTWSASIPGVQAPANPGQSTAGPAFAQAKDQVGGSLTGLMKALQNNFSSRNMTGGSAEQQGVENTLLSGNQQLADVARDQAMKQTDVNNEWANTAYQGGITQRGQDIGAVEAANTNALGARGQDVTARGQDIGLQESNADRQAALTKSNMDAILGLYSSFGKSTPPIY